ncbi:L,D-transpeptidase family protein [Isoptericola croceus]|uniref:L,D-transpeptidase family protein n=1 Tax=Isoptericola croceus TaxID=3031406 RepID=UPI0023F8A8A8|nr:L,D-transpeptidase family protein [Isoptericola croceus]
MTTTTTALRRCLVAAAAGLSLLLVPGCAALSDPTGPDPAAASSAAPTATGPSQETSPTPSDAVEPPAEVPASASPSATPEVQSPSPSEEPSQEPDDEPSAEDTEEPEAAGEDDEATDGAEAGDETEQAEKKADKKPQHLEHGASGKKVRALQEQLVDLGYFLPEADGSFGPQTQQAVWALQKTAGLGRDGVVGPKTRKALKDGVRPSATSSSGKVVEIDLDRQLVLAVEDGRVVRTINASSGNGETFEAKGRSYRASTPRGKFAVYMERDYLHESTLELGSMYRPKYFTGAIAVHGSPSIPPWPASHGCIRVSNSAMDWLWDSWGMPQGTPVVVR